MADFDNDSVMLPMGTMLHERYRIERYLASGGFGNTYQAHDTLFDETVAVKEFFMRTVSQRDTQSLTVSVSNPSNRPSFDSQLRKFRIEAKRVRKLKNEHIVHVHDLFDEFGTSYYVMDYIDGESLNAWLKRRGMPFDENIVRDFLDQMLDALSETHRHSIWHLDIKPGNMMLGKDGKLTLIDFGASKLTDHSGDHSTSSMIAYTAGYAPIEQIEQRIEAIGAHTDLYALGASVYNLLTNQSPPERSLIDDEGDAAFRYPANVSVPMRNLVRYMMQPLRCNRPQSIAQVRQFIAAQYLAPSVQSVAPTPVAVNDDVVVIAEAPKPQPKPAPKFELKTTPKPESNPKLKPASEPVLQPVPKPKSKPAPKFGPKPAPKPEPKPVAKPEPKPEGDSKKGFKRMAAIIGIAALLAMIVTLAIRGVGGKETNQSISEHKVNDPAEVVEAPAEEVNATEVEPVENKRRYVEVDTRPKADANKKETKTATSKSASSQPVKKNPNDRLQDNYNKGNQSPSPKVENTMPKPQSNPSPQRQRHVPSSMGDGGEPTQTQRQRHVPDMP